MRARVESAAVFMNEKLEHKAGVKGLEDKISVGEEDNRELLVLIIVDHRVSLSPFVFFFPSCLSLRKRGACRAAASCWSGEAKA